jgi:hypothetical protein
VTAPLSAFEPFYVYAREGDWLEVGRSMSRGPDGWVDVETVVPWKQNIVAAFSRPAGRERTLFFDDRESLEYVINHEASVAEAERYREAAIAGNPIEDSGVLAVEPEEYVDIRERFYILPILEFVEDFHPMTFDPYLKMRVASLPLDDEDPVEPATDPMADFDVGVVFVIDTTMSMGPYIEDTQAALRDIVSRIGDTDLAERIHFGIWGFRDNNEAVPGLEYRTREYLPLKRRQSFDPVLETLGRMGESRANSPGFPEDSIAGVEDAIAQSNWAPDGRAFGGKYVVLVTDASPKNARDPNARSDLDPRSLQLQAENECIALMTLHLKTPAGQANHAAAERLYTELSRFNDDSFYYPVENGSRDAFRRAVTRFVDAFTGHVRAAMGQAPDPGAEPDAAFDRLGLAMRMAYLGARQGTTAPPVFESWVSDKALEDARVSALEPRLLVSKSELSTLSTLIRTILDIAERSQGSTDQLDFFNQIRDAMVGMAQDPNMVVNTDFETLGEAFGESLGDLPYRSEIMEITESRWANSGTLQGEVLDRLRARLLLYERWHDNPENWTDLTPDEPSDDSETVFAMPFSALP